MIRIPLVFMDYKYMYMDCKYMYMYSTHARPHLSARVDLSSRPGRWEPTISEETPAGERASSRNSSAPDEGGSPSTLPRPFSGDLGFRVTI